MSLLKNLIVSALLCSAMTTVQAAIVPLTTDGQWNSFGVDDQVGPNYGLSWIETETLSANYGSVLEYQFTIPSGNLGTLTVVDAGFAGDRFVLANGGSVFSSTSVVPVTDYSTAADVGNDFNAAFSNSTDFSQIVYTLSAGTYTVSGSLIQSVEISGAPLNATIGAVKVDVTPVPLPPAIFSLLSGLGALGFFKRRRNA